MGDEPLEIREDILTKVTSAEAERVTPSLSLIYLRLVSAPRRLWERGDALRFVAGSREGRPVSAWDQLLALVKVPPEVARQGLEWLRDEGVIAFYTTEDKDEIVISFEGLSSRTSSR
jgi:hypothetical protein